MLLCKIVFPPPNPGPFNKSASRDRQMQTGGQRQSCSLQSGLFETTFKRIFESEALHEPLKVSRQHRIQQAKRNVGKAFLPADGTKKT